MKLFIWDFHGVLEKGNDDAVVEITNLALRRHGYSRELTLKILNPANFAVPEKLKIMFLAISKICTNYQT